MNKREILHVAELEISPGVEMTKGKDWISDEGCRECVPFVILFLLSFRPLGEISHVAAPQIVPKGCHDTTVVRLRGIFIFCRGK